MAKNQSIQKNFIGPLIIIGLLGTVLGWYVARSITTQKMEQELMKRSYQLAESIQISLEITNTEADRIRLIHAFASERDINKLVVLTGDPPKVIASTKNAWIGQSLDQLPLSNYAPKIKESLKAQKALSIKSSKDSFVQILPLLLDTHGDEHLKGQEAVVLIHLNIQSYSATVNDIERNTLLVLISVYAFFIFIVYLLLNKIVIIPVERLISTSQAQSKGNRSERIKEIATGELGQLSKSFNEMLDSLQKIEAESQRLSLVASRTDNAVIISDVDGCIEWTNDAYTKITGYTLEESKGRKPGDFLQGPLTDPNIKTIMSEGLRDKKGFHVEVINYGKDGSLYWLDIEVQTLYDKDKNHIGFMAIESDITARKNAEEALKHNQEYLINAQAIAKIGHWNVDLIENTVMWSKETYRIHEVPENITPNIETGINYYIPEHRPIIRNAVEKSIETGKGFDLELQITTLNKRTVWIRTVGMVEKQNGKAIRLYGVFQDINERRKREQELKAAWDEMDRFFTLSIDLLCIASNDGYFKRLNPTWETLLGYSTSELLATPFLEFVHPDDRESTLSVMSDLSQDKEILDFTNRYRCKDGSYKWLQWSAFPYQKGRIIYAAARDITIQIHNEASLLNSQKNLRIANRALKDAIEKSEKAAKEAQIANKTKSEFLANMSHEIRTPMNAILGFTDILGDKLQEEKLLHYIDGIRSSGRSLLRLINDILDLSKVEAGKLQLEYTSVDLRFILKEMAQIFKPKLKEKSLKLHTNVDPDLPESLLLDEVRIRQILLNLVGNAVKFTDKGSITLNIKNITQNENEETVDIEIAVEDTGIGIPENEKERIFGAFNQQHGQSTSRYGGTGLGLTISQKLAQMMNGQITLESKESQGSTFTLHLANVAVSVRDSIQHTDEDIEIPSVTFSPAEILIVDDIHTNRLLLTEYLSNHPFRLRYATNGQEALDACEKQQPDLILMDMKMPVMNGYEATRRLKSGPYKSIPIVAVTASAMIGSENTIRETCDGYMRKPINRAKLITELMQHLEHTNTSIPTTKQNQPKPQDKPTIENLDELILKLETLQQKSQESLVTSLRLDLLEGFYKELHALAETHNASQLKSFSTQLEKHCNNFEIDQISTKLNELPDLIAQLQSSR